MKGIPKIAKIKNEILLDASFFYLMLFAEGEIIRHVFTVYRLAIMTALHCIHVKAISKSSFIF